MAIETMTRGKSSQEDKEALETEPVEGVTLEADYAEDRPITLLAERQREFQKSMRGQFVEAEMPAS